MNLLNEFNEIGEHVGKLEAIRLEARFPHKAERIFLEFEDLTQGALSPMLDSLHQNMVNVCECGSDLLDPARVSRSHYDIEEMPLESILRSWFIPYIMYWMKFDKKTFLTESEELCNSITKHQAYGAMLAYLENVSQLTKGIEMLFSARGIKELLRGIMGEEKSPEVGGSFTVKSSEMFGRN